MKTKKLLLIAAMLLLGVGSFAHSNETQYRGDVKEDGVVDVADINAIIAVMRNREGIGEETKKYLYIGPTQPTEDNYQSLATEVTSYNDRYEYTQPTRSRIYVLVADDLSVSIQGASTGGHIGTQEVTSVNIPGHKVYITGAISTNAKVYLDLGDIWKHYYFGTTQPTVDNIETLTPLYSSMREMNKITIHVPLGETLYVLFPYSESINFNRLVAYGLLDDEGNHVTYSTRTGSYIGRFFCGKVTFDNEITVTFRYPYYKTGDVTGDWIINLDDVMMTVSHILGQTPEGFSEAAADIDGNGLVDIQDVTAIIDIILQ